MQVLPCCRNFYRTLSHSQSKGKPKSKEKMKHAEKNRALVLGRAISNLAFFNISFGITTTHCYARAGAPVIIHLIKILASGVLTADLPMSHIPVDQHQCFMFYANRDGDG